VPQQPELIEINEKDKVIDQANCNYQKTALPNASTSPNKMPKKKAN